MTSPEEGLSGMDGEISGWRTEQEMGGGVGGVETGSVDGVGSPCSPGARGVAGDFSRHGEARRQRRLQWSQTAKGVNERRHFSLGRRREECQRSRA